MNLTAIRVRIDALIQAATGPRSVGLQSEIYNGTLSVIAAMYGPNSSQEKELRAYLERLRGTAHPGYDHIIAYSIVAIAGALASMRAEIDAGFVGTLRASITGDVLSDLVKLARAALDEAGDEAKNVAAVLAAAAYEDTLRRLAELRGVAATESLADLITALKDAGVLAGAQVGIAQSYLSFRNKALHAQWAKVDRAAAVSVLAFTEQLLVQSFQ
jgi:hypothetical protein